MTVQQDDYRVSSRHTRRRALALGAAGLVTAALSACGNETAATATGASGTVAAAGSTIQAVAASQVPGSTGGVMSTIQAVASQNPGLGSTVQAAVTRAAGTAPAAASSAGAVGGAGATGATTVGGDPASRNNKYQGKAPAMMIDKGKKYVTTIVTSKGTMKAELYADTAPLSVNNFVFLANDHFYDNVIFHRIVKGFVIQGGDPTGTGMGGPGYKFMDEPTSFTRNYEKGTLAMANSGPNTNGSQFFICLDNLTTGMKLPKSYNIFGKVTDGLDVVDKIAATPTMKVPPSSENSTPTERVFMQTVTVSAQ